MNPTPSDEQTPLMKQYWELKTQAQDALLLFRMGDFYELFGQDAIEASQILEITLTSRDKNKPNPLPMAGVPFHSVQGYLQRLLKAGRKVAISEQLGEPLEKSSGKTIVRREIVRTLTPGIQFDLEGSESNYLAAIIADPKKPEHAILACIDASTGEALVGSSSLLAEIQADLQRLPIRHLLIMDESLSAKLPSLPQDLLLEKLPSNFFSLPQALALLKRNYGVESLDAFLETECQAFALATALSYTLKCQNLDRLAHLKLPRKLHEPQTLVLGPRTAEHLDLLPSSDGVPHLFGLLNRAKNSLGSRQLRRWLLSPLKDERAISERQAVVRFFHGSGALTEALASELSQVYDLERILGRVHTRLANPRDTLALGKSLMSLNILENALKHLLSKTDSPPLEGFRARLSRLSQALSQLALKITREQREEAPLVARDGGIFNVGTHPDLDRLLSLTENGQKSLVELEAREREKTGIPSLKVRYNRVFGYYLEVTQAHLKNVPPHYHRKQTTVGGERFITEELKKLEDEILNGATRQKELEQELFQQLLELIRSQNSAIMEAAHALGELDAWIALSRLAHEPGWCFPEIDGSLDLEIRAGRHPLVDQQSRGRFVPNDVWLSPGTRLSLLITGPNMGGKSTVMRQTALIILLGQMGAPVPAGSARWGAVSQLHTRIGAHDAIARGQSTFMVEMSELAHILHHADSRSFIILDEIGRGTSTYDGMSVAWATLEWIATQIRARTLFATHYHELTRLSSALPDVANAHMAVEGAKASKNSQLRFLYLLKEGPTNESFGVHVAQLAGLPKPVIERAWKVLEELEKGSHLESDLASDENSSQLSLFGGAQRAVEVEDPDPHPVLLELQESDPEGMTPLQALNFVAKLREMSRESCAKSS